MRFFPAGWSDRISRMPSDVAAKSLLPDIIIVPGVVFFSIITLSTGRDSKIFTSMFFPSSSSIAENAAGYGDSPRI